MPAQIKNKAKMLDYQQRGLLGNYLRTNPTVKNEGFYTIRSKEIDSPHFLAVCPGWHVESQLQLRYMAGAPEGSLYVQDIPHPDSERIIQGEYGIIDGRDYLIYKVGGKESLREALNSKEGVEVAEGVSARMLLRSALNDWDYEEMQQLVATFKGSIIEFTLFSQPCGRYSRPLIIWEVRNY